MRPETEDIPAPKAFTQTADDVLARLETNRKSGLSHQQATDRLRLYGRNELTAEAPIPAWRKFLAQFSDVLVILLIVAGLVSAGLWLFERDAALPYEAIAIFAIVLLNAVMGHLQQSRAEKAVAALRQMSAAQAKVIRDGERQSVPAAELVPGDVIVIEEGDTVPADARLIEVAALQTAEAALTGESLPVTKGLALIAEAAGLGDRYNMVFSGTAATYGHGRAVVTATGMQTEMGRIAGLLEQSGAETTPLQKQLERVGKLLAVIVVVIAVVMIATILLVEEVRGFSAVFDVLILGVALAVAAVPEGLPAVVTAALSIGVQRMAKRNAIVRHLAAVETLGSANVIASDKTGTLTKNEMTVRVVVTASGRVNFSGTGYAPEGEVSGEGGGPIEGPLRTAVTRALIVADRANNAVVLERDGRWMVQGDPTEGALIVAARKAGLEAAALDARFARTAEVPFSSERKLMSTIHTDAERQEHVLALTKGAPDVLLSRCSHELVGEEFDAADRGAPRRDPARQRGACRRGTAYPRGRLSLAPEGYRARDNRRRGGARSGLPRADRHDRPATGRGPGSRRAGEGRRGPADHDHRRSSEDGVGHCGRARHRRRRPGGDRGRARGDVGRGTRPDGAGGVGLRPGQSGAQAQDRRCPAARRA